MFSNFELSLTIQRFKFEIWIFGYFYEIEELKNWRMTKKIQNNISNIILLLKLELTSALKAINVSNII